MGQDGVPLSLGLIIAASIIGVSLVAGLTLMAILWA
jgi:hypothetical protein